MTNLSTYDAAQAAELVQRQLPEWRLDDGRLRRDFPCEGWRASMLVANGIAHVAELAWHHPDLLVTWSGVTVWLTTHDAGGITERDFELADLIERAVSWRPGEGSSLEGAPRSGRWRYLGND